MEFITRKFTFYVFHETNPTVPPKNQKTIFLNSVLISPRYSILPNPLRCITPRSQTAHRGVKIEIFVSLWWLLLKGQTGEILLGVNTSIIKEKKLMNIFLCKPKILTLLCHAHRSLDEFES